MPNSRAFLLAAHLKIADVFGRHGLLNSSLNSLPNSLLRSNSVLLCGTSAFVAQNSPFCLAMGEELQRKVAAFLENAKSNGSKRPADREEQANFARPHWFDRRKFATGVETGREYFFSIFTAHLSGLVILVYNQSILETLISTGNSQNVLSLFKRYFNTAVHVKRWYDGDVFDSQDSAFSSICQVRCFPDAEFSINRV